MYGKLFEQIFDSSIMQSDVDTRYIWMSLIALADKEGFVDMTEEAISRRIAIDLPKVETAINYFLQPDPRSRTLAEEGRRLIKMRETFGWQIVNYAKYRAMRDEEERKEYMKIYMREYRKKRKPRKMLPVKIKSEKNPCTYCGELTEGFDHVVPISKGGTSLSENLVPCCLTCNSSKSNANLWEWLREKNPIKKGDRLKLAFQNQNIRNFIKGCVNNEVYDKLTQEYLIQDQQNINFHKQTLTNVSSHKPPLANTDTYADTYADTDKKESIPKGIDTGKPVIVKHKSLHLVEGKQISALITLYCQYFKNRWGTNPAIGGKESGILKRVIGNYGLGLASRMIEVFFKVPERFYETVKHELAIFERDINKLKVFADGNGHSKPIPKNMEGLEDWYKEHKGEIDNEKGDISKGNDAVDGEFSESKPEF